MEMFIIVRQREAAPMVYQGQSGATEGEWVNLSTSIYARVMLFSSKNKALAAIGDLTYKIGKLCEVVPVLIDLGSSNSGTEQKTQK